MVIEITEIEFQRIKQILLDDDQSEALALVKILHKRLVEMSNKGMRSHMDTSS